MTELQYDENGMLITNAVAPVEGQGETPVPSIEVEAETEEGQSFLSSLGEGIADVGRGAVQGALNGLEETGETIQWAAETVGNKITGGKDFYIADGWNPEWITEDEAKLRDDIPAWQSRDLIGEGGTLDVPEGPETTTMAGALSSGVGQFAASYLVLGSALKVGKGVLGATTGGAVADFAGFDAHEDRFSDFLRDNLGLQDPITEFLSADEDDSVLEGKLKNAVEGAGLGLAVDGVVRLVRAFRGAKHIQAEQGDEAAAAFMNDEVAKIADEGQLDLFDATTDPNMRPDGEVAAGPQKIVKVGGETADEVAARPDNIEGLPDDARNAPTAPVNTQALTDSLNREIALRNGGSIPNPDRVPESGMFNWDKMDSDIDIKDVMSQAADAVDASVVPSSTSLDEVTREARQFLSDAIEVDGGVIDRSLAQMAENADRQRSMVVAGKALVQSLAAEVDRLAYRIDAGNATKETYEKFVRLQARLIETQGNLKATITGAAQTTSAGRIRTSDWMTGQQLSSSDILRQIDDNINGAGGTGRLDDLARAYILNKQNKGGVNGIFKIAEGTVTPMRVINEVWINAILSGPKTHMINIISNGANTLLFPAERMLGGVLGRNPAMIREGAQQYAGIAMSLRDSMKMARMAFVKGRNLLDPEAAILEANGNDFRAIRSNSSNPVVRDIINHTGTIIRLPSRGLLTMDEFFKQLNYRSDVYARLTGQAQELIGQGKLTRADAGAWIADRMQNSVAKDGSARAAAPLEMAREATFTQELGTAGGQLGAMSRGLQNATNKYPALKLILPFVRTPTNIIKAAVQRTPLLRRLSSSLNADMISGDPRRVAAAQGKLATGSLMWGSAIMLAQQGMMTGSGPRDPAQRRLLMETGWRPNSFVIDDGNGGKRYVEYGRLDPFAIFFGIAADVAEIGGQIDDTTLGDIGLAALVGFTNNVTSKTYLRGLSDFFSAMNDPQRFLPSLANNYASGMIPYSSALRELRKQGDPAMRDVRSMLDAVKNTIPGYSETIPARRSWITGEIVNYPVGWGADMISPLGEAFASGNPITAGDWKQDAVLDELSNLDFAFSAPTRKVQGVELDQVQYARLMELHGTLRSGRYTMYQRLETVFNSARYRDLPTEVSDPTVDPRIKMVQRVISGYREAARAQLIREYPEIATQVREQANEMSRNARGGYAGIAEIGQ